jgi:hypothetical protein
MAPLHGLVFLCQNFLVVYLPTLGLHLNYMGTSPRKSSARNSQMFKTNMEAAPFQKPNNTHNTRPTHRWIRHLGHVTLHQRRLPHHSWPLGWIHHGLETTKGHRHEKSTNGSHQHEKPFCLGNPMEFKLPIPTTRKRRMDLSHATRGEPIRTRMDILTHCGFRQHSQRTRI